MISYLKLFSVFRMVVFSSPVNMERLKVGNVELCIKWRLLLVLNVTKWTIEECKKAWKALNVCFSNILQFEQKLYYWRPGLITRETKLRVGGLRSLSFNWNKKRQWLHSCLCE